MKINQENIKVSIVTVCFNSVKTIKDTMDSVLKQTYSNIEYIVKDGGSTDGTLDLLKKYESMFHGNMKWISRKDCGIYDAMNQGIEMTSGDVIGILNSDDFFTNINVISNMVSAIEREKVDAVYGDIHFVRSSDLNTTVRYYSSKLFRPKWLRFGFMPAHPSLYLRKDIYKTIGLYKTDYKIAADYEMMVRLFLKYHISYYYLEQDFVTMRTGGASTRNFQNHMIGLKEDVKACRDNGIYTNKIFIALKFIYKLPQLRNLHRHITIKKNKVAARFNKEAKTIEN